MNNSIKLEFVMESSHPSNCTNQLVLFVHPIRVIICNCYYCSICPALKQRLLLGRAGLFIRRNREIELKMPNQAGRWNSLMWHSLLKELFFFSFTSSCMQTRKRMNTISQFHKKRVRSQKYRNHWKTAWIQKHFLVDPIFRSALSLADAEGYFWPTKTHSCEQWALTQCHWQR